MGPWLPTPRMRARSTGAGSRPPCPRTRTGWRRRRGRVLPPEAFWYAAGGAGSGATMRANRAAFDRQRIRAADAAGQHRARLVDDRARHRDARAAAARPDRRAVDPAPRRRARHGPRGGRARAADGGLDGRVAHARGGGRGRATAALVPAVLAERRRRHGEPPAPGPRRRVHGARRHARHLAARLAPARPRRRLPAVPARRRHRECRSPTRRSGPRCPRRRRRTSPRRSRTGSRSSRAPRGAGTSLRALRARWDGPIVLKGIQHPDDARAALDAAWTGSSCPTTAAGRSTARSGRSTRCRGWSTAVGDRAPVLFDSGVRTGADAGSRWPSARGRRAARPALRLRPRARRRGRGAPRAPLRAGGARRHPGPRGLRVALRAPRRGARAH